jgi:hypothetical protein
MIRSSCCARKQTTMHRNSGRYSRPSDYRDDTRTNNAYEQSRRHDRDYPSSLSSSSSSSRTSPVPAPIYLPQLPWPPQMYAMPNMASPTPPPPQFHAGMPMQYVMVPVLAHQHLPTLMPQEQQQPMPEIDMAKLSATLSSVSDFMHGVAPSLSSSTSTARPNNSGSGSSSNRRYRAPSSSSSASSSSRRYPRDDEDKRQSSRDDEDKRQSSRAGRPKYHVSRISDRMDTFESLHGSQIGDDDDDTKMHCKRSSTSASLPNSNVADVAGSSAMDVEMYDPENSSM